MSLTKILATLFLLLSSFNLAAEESALTKGTLKFYLSMTNTDMFYEELFQSMVKQYSDDNAVSKTNYEGEKFRESIIDKILPLYSKHYSEQDILKIIAFMNSSIGKKMKQANIDINNDVYGLAGEFGRAQKKINNSQ